ncbi:MAG: ribonuclease HIII [Opitutales bacterium]|nr:ribonuclease HIII [Opitutales bacterium]
MADSPKPKSLYTIKLTPDQMEKLKGYLDHHLWSYYEVDHALFGFKGDKVNVVGYKSGKLVIQGKKTEDFVTNILEPEITKEALLGYDEVHHPEWFEAHAGLDESGKGDLFGPLVVATVIADGDMVREWMAKGIRDSKSVTSDRKIFDLEKQIRETKGVIIETAWANMPKYNKLYSKIGNLNKLLAWFHARALENALDKRMVDWGLLDQFTKQPLTQRLLKKHSGFDLKQRTKAEEDPVVAAASIIARAQYVKSIKKLEEAAGVTLPKGSGAQAKKALGELIAKIGKDEIHQFAKLHFKTVAEVTGS